MSLFRKRKVELPDDLVVKTDFTNNDNDQQELVQNQLRLWNRFKRKLRNHML